MYFKADEMERRCLPTAELRVAEDSRKITGYAALFNIWADIGGWFRESIKPGAFRKTIKEADVRALWNHDPNYVLGRNKSNTLRLYEDSKGLAYEIDPPNTSWANDLMESMRRSDVNQSSFGFTVNKEEIDPAKDERVLVDVSLFDVSVVTYPAYPTTSAQVRAAFTKVVYTDTTGLPPPFISDSTGSVHPFKIEDPPGFSELDRIIRKLNSKEELTEEELRVVAAYLPSLSVPPAKHTETPTEPPAKHSDGDTREGPRWMSLVRKADLLEAIQHSTGGKK